MEPTDTDFTEEDITMITLNCFQNEISLYLQRMAEFEEWEKNQTLSSIPKKS